MAGLADGFAAVEMTTKVSEPYFRVKLVLALSNQSVELLRCRLQSLGAVIEAAGRGASTLRGDDNDVEFQGNGFFATFAWLAGIDRACLGAADAGAAERDPQQLPLRLHGQLLQCPARRRRSLAVPAAQRRQAISGLPERRQCVGPAVNAATGATAGDPRRPGSAAGRSRHAADRFSAGQAGRHSASHRIAAASGRALGTGRRADCSTNPAGISAAGSGKAELPIRLQGALPRCIARRLRSTELPATQLRSALAQLPQRRSGARRRRTPNSDSGNGGSTIGDAHARAAERTQVHLPA